SAAAHERLGKDAVNAARTAIPTMTLLFIAFLLFFRFFCSHQPPTRSNSGCRCENPKIAHFASRRSPDVAQAALRKTSSDVYIASYRSLHKEGNDLAENNRQFRLQDAAV